MINEFLLLAIAHVFAVASPGADFAVVLKNTLRSGKSIGIATSIGVGFGILVHVTYTLLGVSVLLAKSEVLFSLVRYVGAGYLLWLAYQSFQSRKLNKKITEKNNGDKISRVKALKQGFFVNVLNPKVTLFFVALFSNIISPETPIIIQMLYGLWLAFYTMLWFAFIAWSFSRKQIFEWYQNHGYYFDWGMGVVLIVIAVRLISVSVF